MKAYSRFDIGKSFFICITFANDNAFQSKRIRNITVGMFFDYNLKLLLHRKTSPDLTVLGISARLMPRVYDDHTRNRRVAAALPRMCYWKQWRWVRTKVRHLLALGTSKRQAILTALGSKSYWHLARTLATETGMTNAWLTRQGLICVRALWLRAHGYS